MLTRQDICISDGHPLRFSLKTSISNDRQEVLISSAGEAETTPGGPIHPIGVNRYYETMVFDGQGLEMPIPPGLPWKVDSFGIGSRDQCRRQHEAIVQFFIDQLETANHERQLETANQHHAGHDRES